MTPEEFRAAETPPRALGLALEALWWAAKGDWRQAHACVQRAEGTPDCDWVHAYLHRVEGDLPNACYWYRRAGIAQAAEPLADEWRTIAGSLLAKLSSTPGRDG